MKTRIIEIRDWYYTLLYFLISIISLGFSIFTFYIGCSIETIEYSFYYGITFILYIILLIFSIIYAFDSKEEIKVVVK